MKCDVDKIITGTPEKKYYLIKYLKTELDKLLGKEIQIYLVISEQERNDFFKSSQSYLNMNGMSGFSFPSTNYYSFGNSGYSPGELTLPYKNFYNMFESLFHKNHDTNEHDEVLKDKDTKTGGATFFQSSNTEKPIEKTNDDIEIEKFLFYSFNKDLKIRISTKPM